MRYQTLVCFCCDTSRQDQVSDCGGAATGEGVHSTTQIAGAPFFFWPLCFYFICSFSGFFSSSLCPFGSISPSFLTSFITFKEVAAVHSECWKLPYFAGTARSFRNLSRLTKNLRPLIHLIETVAWVCNYNTYQCGWICIVNIRTRNTKSTRRPLPVTNTFFSLKPSLHKLYGSRRMRWNILCLGEGEYKFW